MTNILIIEPTGAICINPNLSAIIKLLCDNSFKVDVISIKRKYQQEWNYPNSTLILCDQGSYELNVLQYEKLNEAYDLVIGVDQAITSASYVADKMKVPLIFISYEILFADEVGTNYKSIEIEACKNVSFAVAQDKVRGLLVSKEYNIPVEKIICIPVSDGFEGETPSNDFLRNHFQIPPDKKIALFTGSVSNKSMINELLGELVNWDESWVLILHSHFGFTKTQIARYERLYDLSKVYFSDLIINDIDDLLKVIASADVGIGFYTPTFETIYECKNMLFIGLSSGKFAMYLKAGLPVIINEVGEMSSIVRRHGLGVVVNRNSDINPVHLEESVFADLNRRSKEAYLKYFDFNKYSGDLLSAIRNCLDNKTVQFNNGIDKDFLVENLGNINLQIQLINQQIKTLNSTDYVTGRNLLHFSFMKKWLYDKLKPFLKLLLHHQNFISQFNDNIIRHYSR